MSISNLTAIGADAAVVQLFEPYAACGLSLGRVSMVQRDRYRVYTAQGEANAEAIGALLYRAQNRSEWPAVGDWVAVQFVGPAETMVHAVLPRKTVFSRRAAGAREQEQVIAANIDLAFVVCGLDHDYNPRRVERYLTLAHESGADAAVILNKADLCPDAQTRVNEIERIARGVPVVAISAHSVECIAPLLALIGQDRTIALLGSSGVGKSTMANLLLGEDRQRVREVRDSDGRGRHTTTQRELLPLPAGGALIDTPGMRELQLWVGQGSLDSAFEDVAEAAAGCRFRNCSHTVEDGCAVRAAIAPDRLRSYLKLRAEIAFHERKTDIHAALEVKKRWKKIHKAMRNSCEKDNGHRS